MSKEEILEKALNEVYSYYKTENEMDWVRYIHPTNWRGDFGEPMEKPEELMTHEEFVEKLNKGKLPEWDNAMMVLTRYLLKQNNLWTTS